jgi:hypothetical protein
MASLRIALSSLLLAPSAFANSAIDHVHATAVTVVGVAGDILTEGAPPGFPAPPVVSIPAAAIGLVVGDEIDALSFGNDPITTRHQLSFSVDPAAFGLPGTGVAMEVAIGTPPSSPIPFGVPKPPEAAGDIFLQTGTVGGPCTNVLAPPGAGYGAGTFTGDESNATWMTPAGIAPADDLDALEYSDPAVLPPGGIYFSLAPGSPSLIPLGATPGDILYSPLGGGPVVIAALAGAGPATDVALGIPGANLDGLNVVAAAPGVIAAGAVAASPCSPAAGVHVVEYSIAPGGAFPPAAVLVRVGPGIAAVKVTPAGLGLFPTDNLDALEAIPMPPTPVPSADGFAFVLIAATLVGIGSLFARRRPRGV